MGFFGNLFSRSARVVKGQANAGIDAIEDATFESTLKQTVRDLKGELNKAVRSSADAMSNHNRLEAEYNKYVQEADTWKDRAKKALAANNEDLARKALARKAEADQQVASMQASVDAARQASAKLRTQVGDLRRKIQEGERNAATLIARKNAAKAQKKVAEALAGVGEADNAFAALKSFEESVSREEARANAFSELGSAGSDKLLEDEFAKLDTSDGAIDDDLAALKKELQG